MASHPMSNRLRQVSFRGRFDDGLEGAAPPPVTTSGATWIAEVDENWSQRPTVPFRVRTLIEHVGDGLVSQNTTFDVTYSHNAGPFLAVTSGSNVIQCVNSAFYTDGDDTTDFVGRIGTGDWADVDNGAAVGASGTTDTVSFNVDTDEIEVEFCFEIVSTDVSNGDTIELDWTHSGGLFFSNGYTASPIITVEKFFSLITAASGIRNVATENQISWTHEFEAPVADGNMLLVFVGGVDSQKPSLVSTTVSGSAKSPSLPTVPLTTAINATGAGGSSFPSGWISYAYSPFPSITGTVTGTITAVFDEDVGNMQGVSAVISGANGFIDGVGTSFTQHTQLPDFTISGTHTTTTAGALLVDMCISESSNHNGHFVLPDQSKFGDAFFSGPKISTSFKQTAGAGDYAIVRSDCGGPFAGVTLVSLALESE